MSTSQTQKRKSKRIRVSASQKVSTKTPAPTPTLKPITPRSQSSSSSSESSTECYLPLDDEGEAREGEESEDVLMLPAVDNSKAKSTIKKKLKNTIVVVPEKAERAYIDIKKGRLGKGKHWDHYKRYLDENDKIRAECIYCSKTFAADPKVNGTSNLTSHIGRCVENPANKTKGTQSKIVLQEVAETGQSKVKSWVLSQDASRKSLAEMIIVDELPFRQVEKRGFRGFVATTCPTFKIPSRHTVARDCYDLYLNEKVSLHSWLKKNCQRVSLTTDTWTSIQRINYMVITAHFIDNDWNLQKRILNFCKIVSHRGEALARGVEDCLRVWGLDEKLFTVTVDNASSNDVMCAVLKESIITNESCIYSGHNLHMRCVAHIANLIVNDGLKLHMNCVEKVRSIVRYVRYSPVRLHLFKEEANKLKVESKKKLVLDVATRWNSTYMMLDVALKYKFVFARIDTPRGGDDGCLGAITNEEWKKIETLVKFLGEFYEFTKDVSGSSYVTVSNVFFYIGNLITVLNKWISSADMDCNDMAFQMKLKSDKYWGSLEKMNMLIFVAIVLNPTHKMIMVEMVMQRIYGMEKGRELAQQVKEFTLRLFEHYKALYTTQRSQDVYTLASAGSTSSVGGNKLIHSLYEELEDKESCDGGFATCELEGYLIEQRSSVKMTDILGWWRLNESRYPILAHMARDVLAIPVTTVPSESAFSTGGRTLDEYRSSLDPKTVQGLLCAQDWIIGKTRSNFNNDTSKGPKGDENHEIEEEEDEEMMKIHKDLEELLSLKSSIIREDEPICA